MLAATSMEYRKIWLADFFHGFPHLDLSLEEANSTFNPENTKYREALGLLSIIPLLCCTLLLLAFLIFFCLRCCRKSQRKQSKAVWSRLCAGFFLLLGCGALATAFYGNAELDAGVGNFVHAVRSTNRTIRSSLQVLNTLDRISDTVETKRIPAVTRAISGILNMTVRKQIDGFIKQINASIDTACKDIKSIKADAVRVNTEEITDKTEDVEYFRWVVTIVVYCVFIAVFFFTFTGLLKKSKWMLIVISGVCVFFMLVIWTLTAAYLILSVAAGDFCVNPNQFVLSRVNGTIRREVLLAYIECKDKSQPYQGEILDSQTAVTQAITALNTTVNISLPFNISGKLLGPVKLLRDDLKFAFGNLSSLTSLVGSCDTIHDEYIMGVRGVCNTALYGAGYLVLCSALVGLFGAFMTFGSALSWPYFRKRRRGQGRNYAPVDDTDPFLPHLPAYEHDYGSFRQTSVNGSRPGSQAVNIIEEDRPVMNQGPVGESPPPAYHPGHFMQQYYNLAPKPSSIVQSSQSAA